MSIDVALVATAMEKLCSLPGNEETTAKRRHSEAG